LLGILFGFLGAGMSLAVAGILKPSLSDIQGHGQVVAGMETGEFPISILGILPLLGAVWYALTKFPGRQKKS
jgi:hypothetical protein